MIGATVKITGLNPAYKRKEPFTGVIIDKVAQPATMQVMGTTQSGIIGPKQQLVMRDMYMLLECGVGEVDGVASLIITNPVPVLAYPENVTEIVSLPDAKPLQK